MLRLTQMIKYIFQFCINICVYLRLSVANVFIFSLENMPVVVMIQQIFSPLAISKNSADLNTCCMRYQYLHQQKISS